MCTTYVLLDVCSDWLVGSVVGRLCTPLVSVDGGGTGRYRVVVQGGFVRRVGVQGQLGCAQCGLATIVPAYCCIAVAHGQTLFFMGSEQTNRAANQSRRIIHHVFDNNKRCSWNIWTFSTSMLCIGNVYLNMMSAQKISFLVEPCAVVVVRTCFCYECPSGPTWSSSTFYECASGPSCSSSTARAMNCAAHVAENRLHNIT